MPPDALTQADRLARLADGLSAAFARSLAEIVRDLERTLRPLLEVFEDTDTARSVVAVRALALRREIRDLLDEAGYDRLARTATTTAVERLVPVIESSRVARALSRFFDVDIRRIEALRMLAELNVVARGDEMALALWRTVTRGIYGLRDRASLLDDLAATLDDELPTVRTLYDTTVSVFSRQVEVLGASESPDTLFAYLGPADQVMRPFCRERVGKVYTRAEIDDMDNGQLPNVLTTGGGYNCRHSWVELAPESEWAPLAESGERIPEVSDELARAPQRRVNPRKAA